MNDDMDRFNAQYRRPKPHFTPEERIRPTVDRRQLLKGSAMLLGLTLLFVVALLPKAAVDDPLPEAAQARSDAQQLTNADCQLIQHMTYTPCGHDLTRRQQLPRELVGKRRDDIAAAFDAWQVTSFSAAEVAMEQTLPIYCPKHVVLMPDEGGTLCIFRNKYGDALALHRSLDVLLTELPDDVQQAVRKGKGFDSVEALEQWLEGVDS